VCALCREPHLAWVLGTTHEDRGLPSIKRISEGLCCLFDIFYIEPLQFSSVASVVVSCIGQWLYSIHCRAKNGHYYFLFGYWHQRDSVVTGWRNDEVQWILSTLIGNRKVSSHKNCINYPLMILRKFFFPFLCPLCHPFLLPVKDMVGWCEWGWEIFLSVLWGCSGPEQTEM